jgi:hypothetical protein
VSRTRWLLASGELGIAHAKAQEKQEEKEKKNLQKKKKGAGCAASPGITGRHTNGEGNLINRKAKERKEKGGRDKRN